METIYLHLAAYIQKAIINGYEYYITPYIVWTNYDIDYNEHLEKYMSPSNLSLEIMKMAGVELPWYLKEFDKLYSEYPAINNQLVIDKEGSIKSSDNLQENDLIKKCRILQYDLLIKKKYIPVE